MRTMDRSHRVLVGFALSLWSFACFSPKDDQVHVMDQGLPYPQEVQSCLTDFQTAIKQPVKECIYISGVACAFTATVASSTFAYDPNECVTGTKPALPPLQAGAVVPVTVDIVSKNVPCMPTIGTSACNASLTGQTGCIASLTYKYKVDGNGKLQPQEGSSVEQISGVARYELGSSVCMAATSTGASSTMETLTLTVTGTAPGSVSGTVTPCDPPSAPQCTLSCTKPSCPFTVPKGTTLTFNASPGSSSRFASWAGCDSPSGWQGSKCTVTMNGPHSIQASFGYELDVAVSGAGSVAVQPAGEVVDCGGAAPSAVTTGSSCASGTKCCLVYTNDEKVTLTKTADDPTHPSKWQGQCTGSAPTCDLTVNRPQGTTAVFQNELVVTTKGAGQVTVSPTAGCTPANGKGTSVTCLYDNQNPTVTITVTPDAGSVFLQWDPGLCSTSPCSVPVNGLVRLTANFGFLLSLGAPTGGAITLNPTPPAQASSLCDPSAGGGPCYAYAPNTSITAQATPGQNFVLQHWTGSASPPCTGSNTNPCTLAPFTTHETLGATFVCATGANFCPGEMNACFLTNQDPGHCGANCTACNVEPNVNASQVACKAGACDLSTACIDPFADCDSDHTTNGCETNTSVSVNSCGSCGYSCAAHAPDAHSPVFDCSSKSCRYTCDSLTCATGANPSGAPGCVALSTNNCEAGCGACPANRVSLASVSGCAGNAPGVCQYTCNDGTCSTGSRTGATPSCIQNDKFHCGATCDSCPATAVTNASPSDCTGTYPGTCQYTCNSDSCSPNGAATGPNPTCVKLSASNCTATCNACPAVANATASGCSGTSASSSCVYACSTVGGVKTCTGNASPPGPGNACTLVCNNIGAGAKAAVADGCTASGQCEYKCGTSDICTPAASQSITGCSGSSGSSKCTYACQTGHTTCAGGCCAGGQVCTMVAGVASCSDP